jgi:hypothetical protein
MEIPDREPDFIREGNDCFWFEEGIELYGTHNGICYLQFENGLIYYKHDFEDKYKHLSPESMCGRDLYPAYKKWLISKCLKEKLK